MITDDKLNEWERLADAAWPSPWTSADDAVLDRHSNMVFTGKFMVQDTNCNFIAAARRAVPALIDEVRRLHAVLEPNLVRNAADAMAGIDGRAHILKASTSVADGHASMTVADTGVGIEPASEPRLSDTLYTTKGECLGLGLSIN